MHSPSTPVYCASLTGQVRLRERSHGLPHGSCRHLRQKGEKRSLVCTRNCTEVETWARARTRGCCLCVVLAASGAQRGFPCGIPPSASDSHKSRVGVPPRCCIWQAIAPGTGASDLKPAYRPRVRIVLRLLLAYVFQDKNLIKAAVDRLNDPDLDEEEKF